MLLDELKYTSTDIHLVMLYRDNTKALDLAENLEHYSRAKHIQIYMHYIWEQVRNGSIILNYIETTNMKADGLTKPLNNPKHRKFIEQLSLEAWEDAPRTWIAQIQHKKPDSETDSNFLFETSQDPGSALQW
jgi:hypothetical protein